VIVLPEVLLYAPNTFTPDDDEFNQDWGIYISGVDIYDFELLIFNRWGQIIWESHDPSATWDGTYNGEYVQQGTYTWTIEAKDLVNDNKYEFNGFINVLK
jgi:gliding motility-associated-like protein